MAFCQALVNVNHFRPKGLKMVIKLYRVSLLFVVWLVVFWSCTVRLQSTDRTGNGSCNPWELGRFRQDLDPDLGVVGCLVAIAPAQDTFQSTVVMLRRENGVFWGWDGQTFSEAVKPRLSAPSGTDVAPQHLVFYGFSQSLEDPSLVFCGNLVQKGYLSCLAPDAPSKCLFALSLSPSAEGRRFSLLPSTLSTDVSFPVHTQGGATCSLFAHRDDVDAEPVAEITDTTKPEPRPVGESYVIDKAISKPVSCACTPDPKTIEVAPISFALPTGWEPTALALSPDGNTLLVAAANLTGGGDKLSELFVSIRDPQTGKFGPFAARVSSETERYRGLAFAPSIPQDPIQYVFLHKDLSVEVYLLSDLLPGANPSPNWSTSVNDLEDANYVASDMVVLSPSSFAAVYTHLTKPSIVGVWLGEGTLGKVSVKKAITGAQSVALSRDGFFLFVGGQTDNKASFEVYELDDNTIPDKMTRKIGFVLDAKDTFVSHMKVTLDNKSLLIGTGPSTWDRRAKKSLLAEAAHGRVYALGMSRLNSGLAIHLLDEAGQPLRLPPYVGGIGVRGDSELWFGFGPGSGVSVKAEATFWSAANGVAKALGTFSSEKTLVGMVNARCDGVIAITAETPYVEYWRYRCQ